ncbi:hypothetical protein COJ51_27000, partial [Bacillus thuringiensis]|uniref:nucleotide-binding domain containing protein n=1 Tax=Bacillus thuringiensis TaxID=1428 RepID=UPI000C00DA48
GLCDALARHLAAARRKQLLAVVGSMSEIAQRQITRAKGKRGVTSVFIDVNDALRGDAASYIEEIARVLQAGHHCIVH